MQPEHTTDRPQDSPRDIQKDPNAAALGRRGGQMRMARLTSQERSALAKFAARARWHPREAQATRARAQEITYLIQQALKDSGKLPLD